jgi:hypothetical protein
MTRRSLIVSSERRTRSRPGLLPGRPFPSGERAHVDSRPGATPVHSPPPSLRGRATERAVVDGVLVWARSKSLRTRRSPFSFRSTLLSRLSPNRVTRALAGVLSGLMSRIVFACEAPRSSSQDLTDSTASSTDAAVAMLTSRPESPTVPVRRGPRGPCRRVPAPSIRAGTRGRLDPTKKGHEWKARDCGVSRPLTVEVPVRGPPSHPKARLRVRRGGAGGNNDTGEPPLHGCPRRRGP